MKISVILDVLKNCDSKSVKEALDSAILKKNEIIPHLIKIVNYFCANYKTIEEEDMSCFFSLLLLSHLNCYDAHESICELMKIPYDFNMLLDDLMENISCIIANTCDGNITHIISIITCTGTGRYVKCCALESLTLLVILGKVPRKTIVDYYEKLLNDALVNKPNDRFKGRQENMYITNDVILFNAYVISECYALKAIELQPLIHRLFKEKIVDENYVGSINDAFEYTDQQHISCTNNIFEILKTYPFFHNIGN
uniref:Uncharacterized protein n=1 Tax=viral metagenome TaxID=1070528 RepID=A0A6C0C9P4_9ZZZZ